VTKHGRRAFLASLASSVAAGALGSNRHGAVAPSGPPERPRPSPAQLAWQRDELAMFLHFGVNTFTDREWGDGREDPAIFNPAALDARRWARAARAAGFRAMILTAKHHDGFCLWPSDVTAHSVARSPWRGGQGDVVHEFVEACRAEGLRPGLYLSPWDRNAPVYGDSPRYNDFYVDQLTELLTRYGALAEVWFDGANGEGPSGRRQRYDWPRIFATVRRQQPGAVIFSDSGPDVRWIGNEDGVAGDPNWSTVDPATVPYPGASGEGMTAMLQHGDPRGTVWRPGETDTSIRPGWFYHPSEDTRVKTVEQLTAAYFASVGRNSKLLLNVPPNRDGVLSPIDCSRIAALHERISTLFGRDVAAGTHVAWRATGARSAVGELDLGQAVRVAIARLEEAVAEGQVVARYTLFGSDGGEWRALSRGETIGYRKLDRFEPSLIRHARLVIEDAVAQPRPITIGLYDEPAP
jgi:alpha-L-fucosidase